MGLIAAWDKKLPDAGERFSELSPKRRALSIAAIPVSVCVVAAFVVVTVSVAAVENRPGPYDQLVVVLMGGVALGFSYLFCIAVSRVTKARKADRAPRAERTPGG